MSLSTEQLRKGIEYNATTTDFTSLSESEKKTAWFAPTAASIVDEVSITGKSSSSTGLWNPSIKETGRLPAKGEKCYYWKDEKKGKVKVDATLKKQKYQDEFKCEFELENTNIGLAKKTVYHLFQKKHGNGVSMGKIDFHFQPF